MHILYITPYAPNPIRVRPYQLLRFLVMAGHEVTLATVWTSDEEVRDLERLRSAGITVCAQRLTPWRVLRNGALALSSQLPTQALVNWQPALARRIGQILDQSPIDVVHVEHLRGSQYGLYVKAELARTQKCIPIVWDSVDCISYLFRQAAEQSRSLKGRLMARLELLRTQRYEGWLAGQFDRVVVTSAVDKLEMDALATHYGAAQPTGGARP